MTGCATRRSAGVSLLEVMVSAVLLAVVATSVMQAFVSLSKLDVKAARHHERTRALAAYAYASAHELDALGACHDAKEPSDPSAVGQRSEAASPQGQGASSPEVCLVSRSRCSSNGERWSCEGEGAWWIYRVGVRGADERHHLDLLRMDGSI